MHLFHKWGMWSEFVSRAEGLVSEIWQGRRCEICGKVQEEFVRIGNGPVYQEFMFKEEE